MDLSDFEIKKLKLERGDILVLRTHLKMSPSAKVGIREALSSVGLEGHKVIVLEQSMELAVLSEVDGERIKFREFI